MTETEKNNVNDIPLVQKVIAVLWPSFLVAGVETVVFYTIFDPLNVFMDYDVSRLGAYSIGFLLFWVFTALPCLLTLYFAKPCKPCAMNKDEIK